ncbi:nucleotide sugar dehydrogenase [Abyssalbus ytuae]|uniref:Nucleotide sugar dehydrogenase n=1 Tax=Abyssalbus ytuae TaxID=2926907 RepID=A0A9E6ZSK1_9FLAO|nr:nucleotide sugar dehydrogenase [Abyssalbus ytuae]UOB17083.1 nucleotide sugar dehydrogenase [Abyssalbus ytuae]
MNHLKIAVIGLGYVGLPLAQLFATKYSVIGYDINSRRIKELTSFTDSTKEVNTDALKKVITSNPDNTTGLFLTSSITDAKTCNYYIITVPTPVDRKKAPDIEALVNASEMVSKVLKKNDIVIYESTVYPGLTEEICVPLLEKNNNLKYNSDFFVGYSPERINPGDKEHTVDKILKVTSGSTKEAAKKIDCLYASVITAGTYLAPSIKVAEAAKVIENTQRDINIAFVNELAKIFNLMGIDTHQVLEAAGTKWNFLPFKPGLVGGHCIGVDPYYLAQKAQELGYHPEIILAGRRINDTMGAYTAGEIIKLMLKQNIKVKDSTVLVLGITFKENCPDVRNTKVIDLVTNLKEYGAKVDVYDPHVDEKEVEKEYKLKLTKNLNNKKYNAVVLAVAHREFSYLKIDDLLSKNAIVYDIKGVLKTNIITGRL